MPKEILLYGDIHSYSAADIVTQMNEARNQDVVLRVNNDGGELRYGWAIITKAKEISGKKLFKNDGQANSMAAFLFCYNNDNEAVDTATFGFHRAGYSNYYESDPNLFTPEDRQEVTDKNAKLRAALEAKIDVQKFVNMTGVTMDMLFSLDQRLEVCLKAEQALACGLINRIIPITPEYKNNIEAKKVEIEAKFSPHKIAAHTETPTTMTQEEVKSKFPETYKAIFAIGKEEGIEVERDRAGSILAYIDADKKGVLEALKSGKSLTETQRSEFAIKAASVSAVAKLEDESADPNKTNPANASDDAKKLTAEAKQKEEFDAALTKHIKKIK